MAIKNATAAIATQYIGYSRNTRLMANEIGENVGFDATRQITKPLIAKKKLTPR